jgi:DNA-binding transcriptional LysR family regulator
VPTGSRVSPAVRAFAPVHPGVEIGLLHPNRYEQAETLRDGRADVGRLRRPFDGDGIRTIPVRSEPKVAVLPATHALASRRQLTEADLDGVAVLDAAARRTATAEEKFELVAAGRGIALVPRSVARSYARPDLAHRPRTDAVPFDICLAVLEGRRGQYAEDFLTAAAHALTERRS